MPGAPLVLAIVIAAVIVGVTVGDMIIRGLAWVVLVWLALFGAIA